MGRWRRRFRVSRAERTEFRIALTRAEGQTSLWRNIAALNWRQAQYSEWEAEYQRGLLAAVELTIAIQRRKGEELVIQSTFHEAVRRIIEEIDAAVGQAILQGAQI